jgi:L-aminopeptidase/D-esterase-like protein
MYSGCITDITGVTAGHYTDKENMTGCTVVIMEGGAVCGVDVRGSAPGTRETDLLRPMNTVQKANALLLTGGSAFGLAAADGVMQWLEERGQGFDAGIVKVPIVPAAVLFDLGAGSSSVRPGAREGYAACEAAGATPLRRGRVGAGTGAAVGKAAGMEYASPGGFGTACVIIEDVTVAACFAVNAFGDIYDHRNGKKIAGMKGMTVCDALLQGGAIADFSGSNTVIGIIGTNAELTKEQACKLASAGQDGIAMSVRPAHTMFDGDTVFAFGTGEKQYEFSSLLAAGAEAAARAIENAVRGQG